MPAVQKTLRKARSPAPRTPHGLRPVRGGPVDCARATCHPLPNKPVRVRIAGFPRATAFALDGLLTLLTPEVPASSRRWPVPEKPRERGSASRVRTTSTDPRRNTAQGLQNTRFRMRSQRSRLAATMVFSMAINVRPTSSRKHFSISTGTRRMRQTTPSYIRGWRSLPVLCGKKRWRSGFGHLSVKFQPIDIP